MLCILTYFEPFATMLRGLSNNFQLEGGYYTAFGIHFGRPK